ncbi:LamG-like jellyroll fold domain-containing protein [Flavobacterium ajazii]|uniref:LamG-like jellyroll fold domain-containing protein n=1 Tax=Flavobacterium ajazii TaxID=2692318 RepID=UPI0013D04524|nr:LamG-like jellyroll fold domain-containing protein [Flavobacterium ajazii]
MKKTLLLLLCATTQLYFAQDIRNTTRTYNFSGHIGGGMKNTYNMPTASNSTTTLTEDRNGNANSAMIVSGSAAKITLPGALGDIGRFDETTIGFWFKKSASGTSGMTGNWTIKPFMVIPTQSPEGYGEGTFIGFNNAGNTFRFGHVNYSIGATFYNDYAIPTGVNVTEWNYYILTKTHYTNGVYSDYCTLTLYVNNILVGTRSNISFDSFHSSKNIYLGGNTTGLYSGYCQGSFDNFRIYKSLLSSSKRTELYNWELNDTSHGNFKAKYDFNGAIGTDTYGNFPAVAYNSPELGPDRFGTPNSALKVSASKTGGVVSHNGIKIPYLNEYFNRDQGTISFWYKKTGNGVVDNINQNPFIMLPNESYNAGNKGISIAAGYVVTHNIFSYGLVGETGEDPVTTILNGDLITDNEWQHSVITFESYGDVKIYHNGQLSWTNWGRYFPYKNNGGGMDVLIGFNDVFSYGQDTGFEGLIDEVIFDTDVYTPQQIQSIYENYSLSKDSFNVAETFTAYPNPTTGIVNISETANVIVFDILGKIIFEGKNVTSFDLSSQTPGVYIAKIITEKGTKTIKIIRQ